MVVQILIVIISVFLPTYFGIKYYLKWSLKKEIYDIPNERSSHTTPTPHGGGLVMVIVCLTSYFIYQYFADQKIIWSYFLAAILVAFVSWLDDLFSLRIIWRFLSHSVAACLILSTVSFPQVFTIPLLGTYTIGAVGLLFWYLWIVFLINAYNFMDGIDGMAGTQAIIAGICWGIFGLIGGFYSTGLLGIIIASSSCAFLIYNWQPARIFMGDVGSTFLGFNFAVLPLLAYNENIVYSRKLWFASVLLVWFFVFDSGKTLLQRALEGKKIWQPHREFLFHKLIIEGCQHKTVTTSYAILTVLISTFLLLYLEYGYPFNIFTILIVLLTTFALLVRVEFLNAPQKNTRDEFSK